MLELNSIWNSVPAELRKINTFQIFKLDMKALRSTNCPCRIGKDSIENLGFVNIAS